MKFDSLILKRCSNQRLVTFGIAIFTYAGEIVCISENALEEIWIGEEITQIFQLHLKLINCVTLNVCEALLPFGQREESHLACAHFIGQHYFGKTRSISVKSICNSYVWRMRKERFFLPSITIFSGSTSMSLQKRSMPSGASISGSSGVQYRLNQDIQRFMLNVSSIFVVRRLSE